MPPPHESELHRQTDGRCDGEPCPQTAAVLAGPRDREERRLDVVLVLAVEHVEHFSREREDTPSEEEDFAEAQIEPVVRRQADLIPLGPERERGAVLSQEPAARRDRDERRSLPSFACRRKTDVCRGRACLETGRSARAGARSRGSAAGRGANRAAGGPARASPPGHRPAAAAAPRNKRRTRGSRAGGYARCVARP